MYQPEEHSRDEGQKSYEPAECSFSGAATHDLDGHIDTHIQYLRRLQSDKGYGYEPISKSDALIYLNCSHDFDFGFNKEHGLVVFSLEQVEARRSFFNDLPVTVRLNLISEKLHALDLLDSIQELFPEGVDGILVDASDIGMSHSVYKLTFLSCDHSQEFSVIVKKEKLANQEFFCELLHDIGWSSFRSKHVSNDHGDWEVYEYTPGNNANEMLVTAIDNRDVSRAIVEELARHAALGDLLGLGDRHMENKVYNGESIVPIDINYLFMEDNAEWTPRYCESGLYEVAALSCFASDDEKLQEMAELFFSTYRSTIAELQNKKETMLRTTAAYQGWESEERERNLSYLRNQFKTLSEFTEHQIDMMAKSFEELQDRYMHRRLLRNVYYIHPSLIDSDPVIRMYLYGDLDRTSSFYLYEEWNPKLMEEIEKLAEAQLWVGEEYYTEENERIRRQQSIVRKAAGFY